MKIKDPPPWQSPGLWRFGWIGEDDYDYGLKRMHVIPRNRFFNIYLHVYTSQDSRMDGLHDHPWASLSIRLWGPPYWEYVPKQPVKRVPWDLARKWKTIEKDLTTYVPPRIFYRPARYVHAIGGIVVHRDDLRKGIAYTRWPVVTLFITGPAIRKWGFYTAVRGWIWHRKLWG